MRKKYKPSIKNIFIEIPESVYKSLYNKYDSDLVDAALQTVQYKSNVGSYYVTHYREMQRVYANKHGKNTNGVVISFPKSNDKTIFLDRTNKALALTSEVESIMYRHIANSINDNELLGFRRSFSSVVNGDKKFIVCANVFVGIEEYA